VVICTEQRADLHMAQLMPLPLTVSCFSKIQIGFTFLVPAHLGSPRERAVKRVCVCVCLCLADWQLTLLKVSRPVCIERLDFIYLTVANTDNKNIVRTSDCRTAMQNNCTYGSPLKHIATVACQRLWPHTAYACYFFISFSGKERVGREVLPQRQIYYYTTDILF